MLIVNELYFKHKGAHDYTLKAISFNVEKGGITTILGPNGSGKSTLFKCLAGIWRHYKGEIYYEGEKIENLSFKKRAKIFSVVPQEHEPLFPYLVFDVVLMGRTSHMGFFSSPSEKDYEIAENALKEVGIEHLKYKPYTKISGGERQLTLIARAITQQSPVMLLDEPTSHLDFRNQIRVLKKIRDIASKKELYVIMTLHDPNMASLFSDKIVVINSGKVIMEGKPEKVINEELIKKIYDLQVIMGNINGHNILFPIVS